jgi:calcineurin-like phosphoesterase family protein
MSDHFTSDLHFFHDNVVEYSNRPWTAEEQTEKLIEIWNKQVKKNDNVYHLGDFAFARKKKDFEKVKELILRLNGRKHFIVGNHCDEKIWQMIEDDSSIAVWVRDYAKIKIQNQKVILCHYAFRTWDCAHHGSYNLYGHSHGNLPPIGKQLDVGIDNAIKVLGEHRLFSWQDIVDFMSKQELSKYFSD